MQCINWETGNATFLHYFSFSNQFGGEVHFEEQKMV